MQTLCIFALGQGLATSSRQIPQGRNAARVVGCSGAISVLALFFLLVGNQTGKAIAIHKKFLPLHHYHPLSQQRLLADAHSKGARLFFRLKLKLNEILRVDINMTLSIPPKVF